MLKLKEILKVGRIQVRLEKYGGRGDVSEALQKVDGKNYLPPPIYIRSF